MTSGGYILYQRTYQIIKNQEHHTLECTLNVV